LKQRLARIKGGPEAPSAKDAFHFIGVPVSCEVSCQIELIENRSLNLLFAVGRILTLLRFVKPDHLR
jgi:hypothetical protein